MEGFRLSPHQKSLYLQQQNGSLKTVQAEIKITGNLDTKILRKAVQTIINRHEILRTGFSRPPGIKIPLQVVFPDRTLGWRELDLSQSPVTEKAHAISTLLKEEKNRELDLETGDVLHCCLAKLSEQIYSLILTLSSLCSDSVSLRNLTQEISQTYQACLNNSPLPDPEEITQYLQFSEWQNELLEDEESLVGQQYWQQQNLFLTASLKLPLEITFNQSKLINPALLEWEVTAGLAQKLEDLAQNHQSSFSNFLFAAWSIFLHRVTQKNEIIIKIISNSRQYEELEAALGLYAKALPIKINVESHSQFLEILEQIQSKLSEASQWQDYFVPEKFSSEKSEPTEFEFEFQEWPVFQANSLTFAVNQAFVNSEPFKLKLNCHYSQQLTKFVFHYNQADFNQSVIQEIAEQFQTFLESLVQFPNIEISRFNLLSEKASQSLLVELNRTQTEFPNHLCVHQLFEAQVEQNPEQIALIFEEEKLTYRQLNEQANLLADSLQKLGVQPDGIVGLCVERSLDLIIGILGILKAGGAYLPLDPIYPKERLSLMIKDAQVSILLTQEHLQETLFLEEINHPCSSVSICGSNLKLIALDTNRSEISQENVKNPGNQSNLNNLAYIIYTSGSTGTPKGVMIEHRQLVHYIQAIATQLNLSASSSFATVSTFAADLGNTVIFPALCTGGCLHLISSERATNAHAFADYCRRHPIDCLKIVPCHLNALLSTSESQAILPRRHLILGGEPLSWSLVNKLQQYQSTCQIFNHYGPTETTVGALTYLVETPAHPHAATVPLGRPLPNTQVYILDKYQQPLPVGVAGELYIGGAGVARGYLNQPDLTAEKFISLFSHYPIYKTGDLARYLPDGNIEFLGRIDNQVKIRGFRIELGEIEALLKQHPSIEECVVIAREDIAEDVRLVAYIVAETQKQNSSDSSLISQLRDFLKEKLPEASIPSVFVELETLPLTPSGKIDRRLLPAPDLISSETQKPFVAPRNAVEEVLTGIWKQVLRLEKVGVHDNFFEIGGHSLLATQLISRIREAFQTNVPVRQLFDSPTVAQLAEHLIATEAKPGRTEKIAQVWQKLQQMSPEEAQQALQRKKVEVKA